MANSTAFTTLGTCKRTHQLVHRSRDTSLVFRIVRRLRIIVSSETQPPSRTSETLVTILQVLDTATTTHPGPVLQSQVESSNLNTTLLFTPFFPRTSRYRRFSIRSPLGRIPKRTIARTASVGMSTHPRVRDIHSAALRTNPRTPMRT